MTLRLERTGAIGHLLIDRPDKRNAFTQVMWEALPDLIDQAVADSAVRVIVLRAAESGAFCAGADISEFGEHARDAAWRARNQTAIGMAQVRLARTGKPVIAAVEGDCIGGGCGLAIACDIRVAGPAARFGITPAKLGLTYPLHDTKLLVDLIGPGQAKRILFGGALVGADEALRIGLIEQMAENAVEAAVALADTIAGNSTFSTRHIKQVVRRILDGQADDDAVTRGWFDQAFTEPDFETGVAAFLAKRKPDFR